MKEQSYFILQLYKCSCLTHSVGMNIRDDTNEI
jgi:hypothetical protein